MADDTPVSLPTPAVGDVWGTLTNSNFREVEGRINTLRQQVIDLPVSDTLTDADVADLIDNPFSETGVAVRAIGVQLAASGGTQGAGTTAARDTHTHTATATAVTPAGTLAATNVQAALIEILTQLEGLASLVASGAGDQPAGNLVGRRYTSSWPARGTLDPLAIVIWIGPGSAGIPPEYVSGTDGLFVTP